MVEGDERNLPSGTHSLGLPSVVIEILGHPGDARGGGSVLTLRTTSAIMVGRTGTPLSRSANARRERGEAVSRGILYTSGGIAGEGLVESGGVRHHSVCSPRGGFPPTS